MAEQKLKPLEVSWKEPEVLLTTKAEGTVDNAKMLSDSNETRARWSFGPDYLGQKVTNDQVQSRWIFTKSLWLGCC